MIATPLIVALDFNELAPLRKLVAQLKPQDCQLKVGKELFTAYGPAIIEELHEKGFKVFLDLKFHDIPSTVYKAVRVAADLGVWMVNVHASGGREMLVQARQAISDSAHQPLLIAVTLLTSLSSQEVAEIGYKLPLAEQGVALAQLAYHCGLDGVVCSAYEAQLIKHATQADFLTVTPGIRVAGLQSHDDQMRVMTPNAARQAGADYLVIGRPITQSTDPQQVLSVINQSIQGKN